MTTVNRPHDRDEASTPNHIRRRLRSRTFAREAIETLAPIYSRGVPDAAITALTASRHDLSERATHDALDHLERSGDIYQSEDGWKVTRS